MAVKQTFQMRVGVPSVNEAGNSLAIALDKWLTDYGPSTLYKNCDNCRHMNEDGPAHCSLWKLTPPASVIVSGCPSHEDKEEIPF